MGCPKGSGQAILNSGNDRVEANRIIPATMKDTVMANAELVGGGFWTTASAMGEPLIGRLQAKARSHFHAGEWFFAAPAPIPAIG
jgi:hypothetical protein